MDEQGRIRHSCRYRSGDAWRWTNKVGSDTAVDTEVEMTGDGRTRPDQTHQSEVTVVWQTGRKTSLVSLHNVGFSIVTQISCYQSVLLPTTKTSAYEHILLPKCLLPTCP